MKSKFPDLLFDNILEQRENHLKSVLSQPKSEIIKNTKLDRVTLFVTHKCNLLCSYCNGPHVNKSLPHEVRKSMLQADMDMKLYMKLIGEWREHGLKYIHFTGGEATIHPELPDYVKIASDNAILSAITTNGVAEPGLYERLIENGLYEIRISIDTFDEEKYDEIVGVKHAFGRLIRNIKDIVRLRDEKGKDIFLILNATIGGYNIDHVRKIMEYLLELRPDDIKFLVAAEQKDAVVNHSAKRDCIKLLEFVEQNYPEKELLKDKTRHLFSEENFGLDNSKSELFMDKCYLPITERTLDARGIYPCSIYLRYNGEPISSPLDPFETQQSKAIDFVEANSCREDDICINNCTRCTRNFNLYCNIRSDRPRVTFNSNQPVYCEIKARKPYDKYVNKAQKIYADILRQRGEAQNPKPFIILKSRYLPSNHEFIRFYFDSLKIKKYRIIELDNWNYISLFLYAKHDKEERLPLKRFLVNQAHDVVYGEKGYLIILDDIDFDSLEAIKGKFRNWFGKIEIKLTSDELDESVTTIGNCCHSPDKDNLEYEWHVLRYFLHDKIEA